MERLVEKGNNRNFIYILTGIPHSPQGLPPRELHKETHHMEHHVEKGITVTLYIELRGSPFTIRTSTKEAPRRDSPYGQPCGERGEEQHFVIYIITFKIYIYLRGSLLLPPSPSFSIEGSTAGSQAVASHTVTSHTVGSRGDGGRWMDP